VSGDFNEEARRALREATALSKRLIAETRQIKAECDARVLDSLIAMFRSDALVCASKIEQRRRKLDEKVISPAEPKVKALGAMAQDRGRMNKPQ
jgi:hypothetical protein